MNDELNPESSNLSNEEKEFEQVLRPNVFSDFNIEIKVINVRLGPVVTLFEILPSAGTKINTIINLAGDISRSMGVGAVRIAQIYGTQYLGVEVPNLHREKVTIKELLSDTNFTNTTHKIPICIGKDISGYIFAGPNSNANRIFIGGKSYKKGFTIEDEWLITAIMQDGFIIEKDGKKKKLSYP